MRTSRGMPFDRSVWIDGSKEKLHFVFCADVYDDGQEFRYVTVNAPRGEYIISWRVGKYGERVWFDASEDAQTDLSTAVGFELDRLFAECEKYRYE